MERIPILLADCHLNVRAHILARLEREPAFAIVGVTETSRDTIAGVEATHPSILLIDPSMRDGNGLDAIRAIRAASPDTTVVVLSAFTDTAQKIELEKMGVRSILNKGIESYQLINTLRAAAQQTRNHPAWNG